MKAKDVGQNGALQALFKRNFTRLQAHGSKSDVMIAQVGFSDYCDLMFVIADLLRLCIMATENDIENVPNSLVRRNVDVACILELALGLLPVDEMEVLDEVRKMMETT